LVSPLVLLGLEGFAAVVAPLLGFAGFASVAAAGLASGLALVCLTGGLASDFASAEASGFFAATRDLLPRLVVCFSESLATAAINAAPLLVGPV
jgi:hypothetical protein